MIERRHAVAYLLGLLALLGAGNPLSGCVPQPTREQWEAERAYQERMMVNWKRRQANPTPGEAFEDTTVTFDRYTNRLTVSSQSVRVDCTTYECVEYHLLALLPGETELFSISIENKHGGNWRFFDRALEVGGIRYEIAKIESDADCSAPECTLREVVAILVPGDAMRARAKTGFDLSLRGSGVSIEFRVPPGLVEGFLRRFDEERSKLRGDR